MGILISIFSNSTDVYLKICQKY